MMNNIIQEALRQLSEEDIQEIRTVDNSELDDEDIDVTEEDLKFEQTMIEFFNELNQDIDLTEDFKTTTSIKYHFNKSLRSLKNITTTSYGLLLKILKNI